LLNAVFAMAILGVVAHVHLAQFVTTLRRYLKYSTFQVLMK